MLPSGAARRSHRGAPTTYGATVTTAEIDIEPVAPCDGNTAIAVATRAFWDDRMFHFFTPDLFAQHKYLAGLFAGTIRDCAEHGEAWGGQARTHDAPGTAFRPGNPARQPYRRFGFEVVDRFTVDDSPPLWQMQREPR